MTSRSDRRRALIAAALWWVVVFDLVFATMVAAPFVAEAYEDSALRFLTTPERYAQHQAEWTAECLATARKAFGVLIVPGALLAGLLLLERRGRKSEFV